MVTVTAPEFGAIEDLRTFLRIIDTGSLSAAATEDRLSVNAVSQRLQKLEGRLGVRLFTRTTRRVHPTDEGLRFAERCRRALGELDAAASELEQGDRGLQGRVAVAVHVALVHGVVLSTLERTLARHPAISIELRASTALEGQPTFDVALWVGDVAQRSLIVRRTGRLKVALAAAPSYVEAHGLPRQPEDLSAHECLRALRSPRETHWVLEGERRTVTVPVSGRFEANDTEALRQALLAGMGIGLRPLEEVLRGVREGRLVHVLPRWGFHILPGLGVGFPPLTVLSPPGRLKVARVRLVADALAEAGRLLG
jgi:DNA-binding transcriptional LysR family regulator